MSVLSAPRLAAQAPRARLALLALVLASARGRVGAVYLAAGATTSPGERAAQPRRPRRPSRITPRGRRRAGARSPAPVRLTGVDAYPPPVPKAAARRRWCSTWTTARCSCAAGRCGAADGEPHEDHDRAGGGRARRAARARARSRAPPCATRARAWGCCPRASACALEALLNGLMLVSGNDAAIALAVHVSGSERRFVALMNERARLWGLRCTRFASSHGLENGNRSCAARPGGAHPAGDATSRGLRGSPAAARRSFRVPDQGRPALPGRPQPADPGRLPRRDRAQDRLHRRGGALLRGGGAARRAHAGGGAAAGRRTRRSTRRGCWIWGSRS